MILSDINNISFDFKSNLIGPSTLVNIGSFSAKNDYLWNVNSDLYYKLFSPSRTVYLTGLQLVKCNNQIGLFRYQCNY